MEIKIYTYSKCSTCQKALKYLKNNPKLKIIELPIVEQPPTIAELKKMLTLIQEEGGTFKNLFNTSGVQYRELKIADQLKNGLSESDALILLSKNGKLIKRPFLIGKNIGLVGFKEDNWVSLLTAPL